MANPQLKNGFTRIANEILEALAKTKLNGTQFRIIMTIFRYTYGFHRKEHEMSETFIAEAVGITKRQVRRELKTLVDNKIIIITKESTYTKARKLKFNKNYKEWGLFNLQRTKKTTEDKSDLPPEDKLVPTPKEENNKENCSNPCNSQELGKVGANQSPEDKLVPQKRNNIKDIYKEIATTSNDTEDKLVPSSIQEDELSKFADLICDYYSVLTRRVISPGDDMVIFQFAQSLSESDRDINLIKNAMSRAKQNWKPKYQGDQIRSFRYFIPAIQEALAAKEAKLNAINQSDNNRTKNHRIPWQQKGKEENTEYEQKPNSGFRKFKIYNNKS